MFTEPFGIALLLFVVALVGGAPPLLQRWSPKALHGLVALSTGVFVGTLAHVALDLFAPGVHGHAGHGHAGHGHAPLAAPPLDAHAGQDHVVTESLGHGHEGHDHEGHDHGGHDHGGHDHGTTGHTDPGHAEGADESVGLEALGESSNATPLLVALVLGILLAGLLHKSLSGGHQALHAGHRAKHRFVLRASYFGLGIHALLAGVGLSGLIASPGELAPAATSGLLIALLVHKGIETFSLGTLMRLAELAPKHAFASLAAFSLITPAGFLGGSLVVDRLGAAAGLAAAFSLGTFLFVTLFELLPESFHDAPSRVGQAARIGIGALLAVYLPGWIENLPNFAGEFGTQTLGVFLELAPFLLVGFAVAGLIGQFLRAEKLQKWLGRDDFRSVALASFGGAPLPLCSCSVIPVAAALRNGGASRGATSAFLIATPETGVDSIAATYAVMDPVMTVARPMAAIGSALITGSVVSRVAPNEPVPEPVDAGCCKKTPAPACHAELGGNEGGGSHGNAQEGRPSLLAAARYGYGDLVDDLAWPLVLGVLASGLLAVAIPADFFASPLFQGPLAYLLMLAVGLPIYVCASASTPVAATLIAKGLSPGAALVFLLASPATNLGSLLVLRRLLGARSLVVHLVALSIVTLVLGVALDLVYRGLVLTPRGFDGAHAHLFPGAVHRSAAVLLALVLAASFFRKVRKLFEASAASAPASA